MTKQDGDRGKKIQICPKCKNKKQANISQHFDSNEEVARCSCGYSNAPKHKISKKEVKESLETKVLHEEWRKGYDLGVSTMLRKNDLVIKIGRAIISALDERYEFQKEDY